MKLVTDVLQTGQSVRSAWELQSAHSTRWPQGMAACVAPADMQIWHSGSLLTGGAEGALPSRSAIKGERSEVRYGAGTRWQLKLWLPSRWHCKQQCEVLP